MLQTINRMKARDEKGFTLVELLIVIAIIAILAAIAIPQFAQYRQRGIRAGMISDAKNCATQAEAYFADNQNYTGFTTVVATTVGGPYECKMSAGNTPVVAPAATTYTITVSNPNGGTGSTNCAITQAGAITWS